MSFPPALKLMRLDKPIGILLLWWPTAWALWLANNRKPPYSLLIYFLIGTLLMRSAGCIMNDIADRNIDKHVRRTRFRPLTCGLISFQAALGWLVGLLALSAFVLLQLPDMCVLYAFPALLLALSYPFFKRFFPNPQFILSLAFSMGIPMAYVASSHPFDSTMVKLFGINILWVLAYDTIYAFVDKEDDEKIGVLSMARLCGKYLRPLLVLLQLIVHVGWLIGILGSGLQWPSYVAWFIAGINIARQWWFIKGNNTENWFRAFKLNGWYGFWLWCTLVI